MQLWWQILKLRFGSRSARQQAVKALAASKNPKAIEPLADALHDWRVYEEAGRALVGFGNAAVDAILRRRPLGTAAIQALGSIGDPKAFEALLVEMKIRFPEKDPYTTKAEHQRIYREFIQDHHRRGIGCDPIPAAEAIGKLNDPRAVEPLIEALKDDWVLMRKAAARGLSNLRHPSALQPLLQLLRSESQLIAQGDYRTALVEVRSAVIDFGDPTAVPVILDCIEIEYGVDGKIPNEELEASVLARIGPAATQTLVQALSERGPFLRSVILKALAHLGYQPQDPSELIRFAYMQRDWQKLEEVAFSDSSAYLGLLAEGVAEEDLEQALRILWRLNVSAVTHLKPMLHDNRTACRWLSAIILGQLNAVEATPDLREAANDLDPDVRAAATGALTAFQKDSRSEQSLPNLYLLPDEEFEERYSKSWEDGRVENIAYYFRPEASYAPRDRVDMIAELERIGTEEASSALVIAISYFFDKRHAYIGNAFKALERMGHANAVRSLLSIADYRYHPFHKWSFDAIESILIRHARKVWGEVLEECAKLKSQEDVLYDVEEGTNVYALSDEERKRLRIGYRGVADSKNVNLLARQELYRRAMKSTLRQLLAEQAK